MDILYAVERLEKGDLWLIIAAIGLFLIAIGFSGGKKK